MIIGHLPIGYFTTRYLIKKLKLPLNKFWLGLGIAAAVVPDLDYAYWLITNSQTESHRGYFTTYPFFYFLIFLLWILIYFFLKKAWLKNAIIIVFVNIFIHFLFDTPFYGIKWLYPFSNIDIGIYNVGSYTNGSGILVQNYFTHWYWYLEIALWVLAIISIIISYRKGEFIDKK